MRCNRRGSLVGKLFLVVGVIGAGAFFIVRAQVQNVGAAGGLSITSISPTTGPTTGYTWLTIKGTGFPDKAKTSDYEQSGLIAHFDGLDNVGLGDDQHDDTATTWVNLTGNANAPNLLLSANASGALPTFNGNVLSLDGVDDYLISNGDLALSTYDQITVEFIIRQTHDVGIVMETSANFNTYYGTWVVNANHTGYRDMDGASYVAYHGLGIPQLPDNPNLPANYHGQDYLFDNSGSDLQTHTLTYSAITDLTGFRRYFNSELLQPYPIPAPGADLGSPNWALEEANANAPFGDFPVYVGSRAGTVDFWQSDIAAIRIYGRKLTAAEITNNYEVDQNRFLAPPTVKVGGQDCTNLVIVSDTEIKCRTPAMSGGQAVDTPYDVKLTYDGDTVTATQTFTYKNFSLNSVSPNRGPTTGGNVISIFGSDFPYVATDDYVQDGLVAHFDGINNTGQGDKYRSSTTTTWKNLADDGRPELDTDAVLNGFAMTTNSGWRPNSLFFDGSNDYATFRNPLFHNIGDNPELTVELVMMKDASSSTTYGEALDVGGSRINSYTSYGFWTTPASQSSRRLEVSPLHCNANQSGASTTEAISVSNFDPANKCRTIANFNQNIHPFTLLDYNNGSPTTTVTLPNTQLSASVTSRMGTAYTFGSINTSSISHNGNYTFDWFHNGVSLGEYTYPDGATIDPGFTIDYSIIGSSFATDNYAAPADMESNGNYDLKGEVYAVRYYNRKLSAEEIAQNAALDQIRYLDAPSVTIDGAACTNVAVISSTEIQCTAPVGSGANKDVVVTRDSYSYNLTGAYTYTNDFYISSWDINHGNAGNVITFTGNGLDTVDIVRIDNNSCTITGTQTANSLTCIVPIETNYSNNTKNIRLESSVYDDLTLEQAWTYDDFLELTGVTNVDLSVNPNATTETVATAAYSINTNSIAGYSLTIQTSNTRLDHHNDLLCTNGSNNYYINALTESSASLPDNHWAYKTSTDTKWRPPSLVAQTLQKSESPTAFGVPDQIGVLFGAKVDYSLPACAYSGTVLITISTN
ncbi:MAG: IPT/TIG domain-containing protein [Candidatus Nomurabacteria bacterium]|nr:IPT/TIG domain-containing protein [Candidatus Nomurabacteria bacterium]